MSYHVFPRALERLGGKGPKAVFADSVHHILNGSQSAMRLFEAARPLASSAPSPLSIEQMLRELWAVDLNPMAQVARKVRSTYSIVRCWNAYSSSGNVSTPLVLQGEKGAMGRPQQEVHTPKLPILTPTMTSASIFIDVLTETINRANRKQQIDDSFITPRVSGIARVLGQQSRIVYEASLFFEANPGSNVAALSRALGCHQRTIERQFREEGISAIKLKRACALVGATNDLWGTSSLAEIAAAHGYSDQAHMSREIRHSTGGLSPTFFRNLLQD